MGGDAEGKVRDVKKGPRGPLSSTVSGAHLQLDGRNLAGMVPPQAQVSWPLAARVGVRVMVAPSMVASPKPWAVAVTTVPLQVTEAT